jgi:TM2 domain-containing membrane protein YozV
MSQKIWVIPEQDWEASPAKNRIIDGRKSVHIPDKGRTENRSTPRAAQKNPALSFSFSMLLWGGGQLYVREYGSGTKFMASMLFFYTAIAGLVLHQSSVSHFLFGIDIPVSVIAIGVVGFFAAGLTVWVGNAVDAYYRATRSRAEPFRGVGSGVWPLLCSMLFPGWGQFVNGQPRKGFFFLPVGLAGLSCAFVLLVTRSVWPVLRTSQDRLVFEIILTVALSVLPLVLLLWIVSMYDAFRSGREFFRAAPGLVHSGQRVRRPGALQDLVPRGTAVLGLLLAISLGMQFIPQQYYLDSLVQLRLEMLRSHMEIVPELLGKAIEFIDR